MKLIIITAILISTNAFAGMKLECAGQSTGFDPRVSVEKIILDFPQDKIEVDHKDMRLEVVGLFTPYNSRSLHFWEQNEDYFIYSLSEQNINFAWGSQHYGDIYTYNDGKSFKGTITVSKKFEFNVNCKSL